MRVAKAVMHNGRIILPAGRAMTESDVRVLQRSYAFLSIQIGDPILDNVIEFEDDSREREVAAHVVRKVSHTMTGVYKRFASRASTAGMDFKAIEDSMSAVLEYLNDNPVSAALLARSFNGDSYLTEHSGNVFYLSMMLGAAVRDYVASERQRQSSAKLGPTSAQKMLPLGLGAMFCDLGMFSLQHLFKTNKPLTEQERDLIREHPQAGADMLPGSFSAPARMIVRTHHENFDGSGYPQRLPGYKLHIFTRIVRITDSFDAATATHVYKQAKSAARTLWDMTVGPYKRFYDPALIKVFSRLIQPFPIGSKLRLADGRYAVVIRYNRDDPFSPTIVIAFDENGKRLSDDRLEGPLDPSTRDDIRFRYHGREDISYIYDINAPRDDVRTRDQFNTLFEASFP